MVSVQYKKKEKELNFLNPSVVRKHQKFVVLVVDVFRKNGTVRWGNTRCSFSNYEDKLMNDQLDPISLGFVYQVLKTVGFFFLCFILAAIGTGCTPSQQKYTPVKEVNYGKLIIDADQMERHRRGHRYDLTSWEKRIKQEGV